MKPTCDWSDFAVPIFHGMYDSKIRSGEDYETKPLRALLNAPPSAMPKQKATAFIPTLYFSFDARCHDRQRKKGQFVALTGDVDKGNLALYQIARPIRRLFGKGTANFIYSSASATQAEKRWRVIVPLLRPVPFVEWHSGQTAFYNLMENQGIPMDRALARAAQPVFLPNVPADSRDRNGRPRYYEARSSGEAGLEI